MTYYVVAHFHLVLSMGAVFGLVAAFYYWIGKITGFQYNELLGHIHFYVFTSAVLLIFGPMHGLGLAGMPRRIPNYPDGYMPLNGFMTIGSILTLISFLIFIYLIIDTFRPLTSQNSVKESTHKLAINSAIWVA